MRNLLKLAVILGVLFSASLALVGDGFSSGPPRVTPDVCGWGYVQYFGNGRYPESHTGMPRLAHRRLENSFTKSNNSEEAACFAREAYKQASRAYEQGLRNEKLLLTLTEALKMMNPKLSHLFDTFPDVMDRDMWSMPSVLQMQRSHQATATPLVRP